MMETAAFRRSALTCLGLAAAVFFVYGRSLRYDFVNFDDLPHLVENRHVVTGLSWENLAWEFGIHGPRHWHPLTWLSHQADFEWFGLNAELHRAVNVGLHALSVILLFLTLERMTGRWGLAAFAACAFAVHPLNVESVVWVAERSNVLCGVFWMAALWWYERYTRRPRWTTYLAVLFCHAAALMSKPLAVTLPCVLLLLDYWPLGRMRLETSSSSEGLTARQEPRPPDLKTVSQNSRPASLRRIIIEKVPLFALSIGASVLAVLTQRSAEAMPDLGMLSIPLRLANAVVSYGWYLQKTVWPAGLACYYPHPVLGRDDPWSRLAIPLAVSALVLIGLTGLAVARRRRFPCLLVGWLWFLGVLVPMIGVVQIGSQQQADRYAYLPIIGLFLAMGIARGRFAIAAACVAVCVWGAFAFRQTAVWSDSATLYAHAVEVDPRNHWAHTHLGALLASRGDTAKGLNHLSRAVALQPGSPAGHFHLGMALQNFGESGRAIEHLQIAVRLNPADALAQQRLGVAFAERGDFARAIPHLQAAVRSAPGDASARFNLGLALANAGRMREAAEALEQTRRLQPDNVETLLALALALRATDRTVEARSILEQALVLSPDAAEAHFVLGEIERDAGNVDSARRRFQEALRLRPEWPKARDALSRLAGAEM